MDAVFPLSSIALTNRVWSAVTTIIGFRRPVNIVDEINLSWTNPDSDINSLSPTSQAAFAIHFQEHMERRRSHLMMIRNT